ncbi:MAG: PQQ-binding-like beta-propeller repeat protein [Planctomycetota bacterium]
MPQRVPSLSYACRGSGLRACRVVVGIAVSAVAGAGSLPVAGCASGDTASDTGGGTSSASTTPTTTRSATTRAATTGAATTGAASAGDAASTDDGAGRVAVDAAALANERLQSALVTELGGLKIVHDDWRRLGYRWSWTSEAEVTRRGRVSIVEPIDEGVAVIDSQSRLSVLDAESGRVRWATNVATPLTAFVDLKQVGDSLIAFGRPELFIFDATGGDVLQRHDLKRSLNSPPAIYEGVAVFGSPGKSVLAHGFADTSGALRDRPFDRGVSVWKYDLSSSVEARPALMNGSTIGMVSTTGDVFFVDARTGSAVSRTSISGGVDSDPVTDGRTLFVASLDQSVYALRPGAPRPEWRYRTAIPLTGQPALHEGTLYVDIPAEGLVAFDARTGAKLWTSPEARGDVIAIRRGELVVQGRSGLQLVDARRGDVLASIPTEGIDRLVPVSFVDDAMYAMQADGTIARFDPR